MERHLLDNIAVQCLYAALIKCPLEREWNIPDRNLLVCKQRSQV